MATLHGLQSKGRSLSGEEFLLDVAVKAYERFMLDVIALDLCVSSTILAWQAVDWIAFEKGENRNAYIELLKANYRDFEYLQAAANALKHREIAATPKDHIGLSDFVTSAATITVGLTNYPQSKRKLTVPPRFLFADGTDRSSTVLIHDTLSVLLTELNLSSTAKLPSPLSRTERLDRNSGKWTSE